MRLAGVLVAPGGASTSDRDRRRRSAAALRLATCAVIVGAVLAGALPSTASVKGVSDDVHRARRAIDAAQQELSAAEKALEERRRRQAELQQEAAAARGVLEAHMAQVAQREAELAAAERAHEEAVARRAAATAALFSAVADYDRSQLHAQERSRELAAAAAAAYVAGDPKVQTLGGVVNALDSSGSVSRFLSAMEQLEMVTEDSKGNVDEAEERLAERKDGLKEAADEQKRSQEAVAEADDARTVAAEALDAARARQNEAFGRYEVVRTRVLAAGLAVQDAAQIVGSRTQRVHVARTSLRSMRWRAGVPGSTGEFVWPTDGSPGSPFGYRVHPIHGSRRMHNGLDIAAPTGQPIVAAAGGRVIQAGPRGGYGLTVEIDHGRGVSTLYAHMSGIGVSAGQTVGEADYLGAIGSTGQSTGPHLHFEIRYNGEPSDPMVHFS